VVAAPSAIFLRGRSVAYEAQEDRNRSRGYRQDRTTRDSGVTALRTHHIRGVTAQRLSAVV
jgi:hypothetical protein